MFFNLLKNLPKELSVFIISLVMASLFFAISYSWWQTAYNTKVMAQDNLNEAKQRYYSAIDQKKLLTLFEEKYKQLMTSGIVGDEDRLNWIDALEKITSHNKIPYLKYNVGKRQTLSSNEITQNYPGIQLSKSVMTLNMQLLHEGDLYTIINNLHNNAKGLFDIKSCAIVRNLSQSNSLAESETDKNFSAKCELNWYTLQQAVPALPTRGDY